MACSMSYRHYHLWMPGGQVRDEQIPSPLAAGAAPLSAVWPPVANVNVGQRELGLSANHGQQYELHPRQLATKLQQPVGKIFVDINL